MIIDVFAAFIALWGFWYGRDKGLISIIFRILSVVFGLVLSFKMAPTMARILERVLDTDSPLIMVAAFIINLIFIIGLFSLAARGSEGAFRVLRVNFINQILGGAISALFYLFLYGSVLWFIRETRMISPQTEEESTTLEYLANMPEYAKRLFISIKPFVQEAWDASVKWMDKAKELGEQKTQHMEKDRLNEEQSRIYKIEEGQDGRIEKKPYDSRPKNRELYEDPGVEY